MKTWVAITGSLVVICCVWIERCAVRHPGQGRRARETHRAKLQRPAHAVCAGK